MEPCGPFGPEPPVAGLESLLWQSVQSIWLVIIHDVMRLGTLI
jgi:hypothetical protein